MWRTDVHFASIGKCYRRKAFNFCTAMWSFAEPLEAEQHARPSNGGTRPCHAKKKNDRKAGTVCTTVHIPSMMNRKTGALPPAKRAKTALSLPAVMVGRTACRRPVQVIYFSTPISLWAAVPLYANPRRLSFLRDRAEIFFLLVAQEEEEKPQF